MWFRWSRASSLQSCGTDELSHALTCPLCRRLLLQQQQQPRCPGTVPGTRWTARHLTADSHAQTPDTVTDRTVRLSPVSKYDTIYSWLRDHSRSRFPGLARENYTAAQRKVCKEEQAKRPSPVLPGLARKTKQPSNSFYLQSPRGKTSK